MSYTVVRLAAAGRRAARDLDHVVNTAHGLASSTAEARRYEFKPGGDNVQETPSRPSHGWSSRRDSV